MFQKVMGQEEENAKGNPQSATNQSKPAASSSSSSSSAKPAAGSQRNVLSNDVEIKGTVKFASDLVVDGRIEGEIQSQGSLTVGENATIKAEIKTKSVVVYGKVHGNIICSDRIEIKGNAEVVGDITAAVLTIEAGAVFVGKSQVGTPKGGSAAPSKPAEQPSKQPQKA